jgi:hypothetical protein
MTSIATSRVVAPVGRGRVGDRARRARAPRAAVANAARGRDAAAAATTTFSSSSSSSAIIAVRGDVATSAVNRREATLATAATMAALFAPEPAVRALSTPSRLDPAASSRARVASRRHRDRSASQLTKTIQNNVFTPLPSPSSSQLATPPRQTMQVPESDYKPIPGTNPPIMYADVKGGSGSEGGVKPGQARPISRRFPSDRVGVVNADTLGLLPACLSAQLSMVSIPDLDAFQLRF